MNRIIAVGTGVRLPDGPVYSIFEVFDLWPIERAFKRRFFLFSLSETFMQ